jgi:hypothetical protein
MRLLAALASGGRGRTTRGEERAFEFRRALLLAALTLLADDELAVILDTLALVRLGRAQLADDRREVANQLFVRTRDGQSRVRLHLRNTAHPAVSLLPYPLLPRGLLVLSTSS